MEHSIIRQADSQELEELLPLFHQYRKDIGLKCDVAELKQFLKDRLRLKDSVIFVAFSLRRGILEPVGFAQVFQVFNTETLKRSWQINDLFVKLEARRQGIGKQLINRIREFGHKSDASQVLTGPLLNKGLSEKVYSSLGFSATNSMIMNLNNK